MDYRVVNRIRKDLSHTLSIITIVISCFFAVLCAGYTVADNGTDASQDITALVNNRQQLSTLFEPLYVTKEHLTDCSFVSAFMLMSQHDEYYPYRILKQEGSAYIVKFPGLSNKINVSAEEIKKFYRTKNTSASLSDTKGQGYTPKGMEILRAAYYIYQRENGLRPPKYMVYGGGQPIQDLMVLSGIKQGGKIVAVQGYDETPPEYISFANGLEQKVDVFLDNGKFKYKKNGFSDELPDPLSALNGDLSNYLVSVSSVRKIGFFENLFGTSIVTNHAYYFLGFDKEGKYILGDAYNTRQAVHIGKQEFLKKFNAIYYVRLAAQR